MLVMLLCVACGGEKKEAAGTANDNNLLVDTRPPIAVTEGGQTVVVTLDDNVVGMPTTVPPGPTVFTVTNSGQKPHNFVVERDTLDWRLDEDLQPAATKSVQVDLQAGGTYRAYCPLEGHAEQLSFTVSR